MSRARVLDEQLRAVEVLIELFRTGLPATVWHITDKTGLAMGSPVVGISDHDSYITMVRCAERLRTKLEVVPPREYWQSQGSDEEHSPPAVLVRPQNEKYLVKGVHRGMRFSCEGTAREGTAKKTTVPKSRRARSLDPVVAAQLQALTVLRGLLSADLPPLSWRLRPERHEPRLTPEISVLRRRREARAELVRWADFLGTRIRYDPSSTFAVSHGSAEVTGCVDGVPITITAYLRRPLSDTRLWQAFRRLVRTGERPTTR